MNYSILTNVDFVNAFLVYFRSVGQEKEWEYTYIFSYMTEYNYNTLYVYSTVKSVL